MADGLDTDEAGSVVTMPDFDYSELLPLGEDTTTYRKLTSDGVSTFEANGQTFLKVEPEALTLLPPRPCTT